MAEYRTIYMGFWSDPYIEGLDAKTKFLYMYLFTNSHTDNLGVAAITKRKIAFETGLEQEELEQALQKLIDDNKIVYDQQNNLLLIVNFIKNQTSTSPKMLSGLKRLASKITSPLIANALCKKYPELFAEQIKNTVSSKEQMGNDDNNSMDTLCIPYTYPTDTVSIPYTYPMHTHAGIGRGRGRGREEYINTPPHPPQGGESLFEQNSCEHSQLADEQTLEHLESQHKQQIQQQTLSKENSKTTGNNTAAQSEAIQLAQEKKNAKEREKSREPTGNSAKELQSVIANYTENADLRKTLEDYRLMRERMRKPMTGRAFDLILAKLNKLAGNDAEMKIKILEQSIVSSWTDVYQLKNDRNNKFSSYSKTNFQNSVLNKNMQVAHAVLAARQERRRINGQPG